MDAERWARTRAIFDQLVDAPASEWPVRLDELGVLDPALRAEVLALLRADEASLLHEDVGAQAPNMLADLAEDHGDAIHRNLTGQRVGAFRLVRELGRGGMGTVWLADRVDGEFDQQVAIKLIRPGWDASEVFARFRAERQILAGLVHPNIAHLIDGGVTDDGRPWLALEYIDGIDLRAYCDQHRLDIAGRLELFVTVCAAVSHAHSHLVVHRDIKPSNLLVTAGGAVKLLDFGIAKLIDTNAQVSVTRVFTPEYAAPEQVRGEVVTTAVDVYALGLLLYELLSGRRPYLLTDSTPAAYERAILDQEPTRPSVAVTRDGDAVALAAQRELTPQRLRSELRGDLDAIVLKALRKEPTQRYASVAEFAADIERHVQRRPVLARRGGLRYRTSRFLHRHALFVSAAALVLIALGVGLLVALHQRHLALVEARKAERVLEFMVDNYRLADPGRTNGEKISARELLDRGSLRVTDALQDVPEARAQLQESMGRAYAGLGFAEESLRLYEPALAQRRELGEPVALAHALLLRASALKNLTRNEESVATLDEARALFPRLPDSPKARAVEAQIRFLSGMHHFLAKRYDDARSELSRALEIQRAQFGLVDERALDSALFLSRVIASQGDFDASIALIDEAIEALRASTPARPAQLLEALNALGAAEGKRGRHDRADAANRESAVLAEQVYGPAHWYVAIALNNVGKTLLDLNRPADALAPMTDSVRIARAALPPTHGLIAASLKNLAAAEFGSGRFADAKRDYLAVLEIARLKPDTRGVDVADITARVKVCDDALAASSPSAVRRRGSTDGRG